jgi:hypothetical protein
MSVVAQPRSRPILAIGSLLLIVGLFVAAIVVVQQALVARSPSGYQVGIVNLGRQIGLAPPQPTFGDPRQPRGGPGAGGPASAGAGGQLGIAAQAIGVSMEQLRTELASASLTQVAHAHGVDPAAVSAAMKSASDAQVDSAVSDGRLSADQAAQRKTQAEQRVDLLMTQVAPFASSSGRRNP